MIYAAAFANADGTFHWTRFATDWIDADAVRMECIRRFGMKPAQITNAGSGATLFRDRRER